MAALLFKPAFGLLTVTLRTGAVAAGVIAIDFLLAVIALTNVTSKHRRAAVGNVAERAFLNRGQAIPELFAVGGAMEAKDFGHLQHTKTLCQRPFMIARRGSAIVARTRVLDACRPP